MAACNVIVNVSENETRMDTSENITRMATGTRYKEDKQFVCSICVENYTNPRYLPTCGHTFCEQCLFTHARNLQQQGRQFECPFCTKSDNFPVDTEVTLDWIQTFPLNTVIIQMMESLPNSGQEIDQSQRVCDPCNEEGETIAGVQYCVDCREVLCEACSNYHKKFKATRNHKVMDAHAMPVDSDQSDVGGNITKCSNHPDREVEFYCNTHDAMVCAFCAAKEHKPCDTIDVPDGDIDSTKLAEDYENIITQMKTAIKHINLLQKLRTENKNVLKRKLKEIRVNIQQVRDHVADMMDKVVRHVTDVTKQIEIEKEDGVDVKMVRVAKMKEQVEANVSLLDAIRQHRSDRHNFVSVHLMKRQTDEIAKQISEEDTSLKNLCAELKVADDIKKLIENTDVETLVEVKLTENKSDHVHLGAISTMPVAETNHLKNSMLVKNEDHEVHPNVDCTPVYPGIAALHDGRVVLTDYSKTGRYLCLYNTANKTLVKLQLQKQPYGVTQIDDTHIAVTIPENSTISMFTVGDELRVEKTLKIQNTPTSIIALNNGQLAWASEYTPAFGVIDISGTDAVYTSNFDEDISGRKFKSFHDLAVDEGRQHVIQPCYRDRAVFCFDFTGVPVFKYTHRELLNPQGVAIDACGNIYICEYQNCSIHKVSPLGEPVSITMEGIPRQPRAICSDSNGTGFWVTNQSSNNLITCYRLEQE